MHVLCRWLPPKDRVVLIHLICQTGTWKVYEVKILFSEDVSKSSLVQGNSTIHVLEVVASSLLVTTQKLPKLQSHHVQVELQEDRLMAYFSWKLASRCT